ncbi:MAG: hypothetical protein J0L99_14900 [Chitinophagales bacterium]|nr:hypothetical protein [Chitinophagales bacterium]
MSNKPEYNGAYDHFDERAAEYHSSIRTLLRFLTREEERGYGFATSRHPAMVQGVNAELKDQARRLGKKIQVHHYENDQSIDDRPLVEQLRQAIKDADALVVTGLDEVLQDNDFVQHLNFSREELNALGKPILFWVSEAHLQRIGNRAADLFSQRRISTINFEDTPHLEALLPELERRYRKEQRSSEAYEVLEQRVKLLKAQLKEAAEANLSRRRIAADIVLSLAKTYSEQELHAEAIQLMEAYNDAWDEGDLEELHLRARIYWNTDEEEKAIVLVKKAIQIIEAKGEGIIEHISLYEFLGNLQINLKRWNDAIITFQNILEVVQKSSNNEHWKSDDRAAYALHRLSFIKQKTGEYFEAVTLSEASLEFREKLLREDPRSENYYGKGLSLYRLANIARSRRKSKNTLEYYKKSITEFEKVLAENPDEINALTMKGDVYYELGYFCRQQKNYYYAELYLLKAHEIYTKICKLRSLSFYHENALRWCNSELGILYKNISRYNLSIGYLKKVIEFNMQYFFIKKNIAMLNSLSLNNYNIARCYESRLKFKNALWHYKKSCYYSGEVIKRNPDNLSSYFSLKHDILALTRIYGMRFQYIKALSCLLLLIKNSYKTLVISRTIKERQREAIEDMFFSVVSLFIVCIPFMIWFVWAIANLVYFAGFTRYTLQKKWYSQRRV